MAEIGRRTTSITDMGPHSVAVNAGQEGQDL